MTAVAGIYVAFNNTHLRARAEQKLLNDSQFALEFMAREIRKSYIVNYAPDPTWCNDLIRPSGSILTFDKCIIMEREDGQTFAFTTSDYGSHVELIYLVLNCDDSYSSCDAWKNDYQAFAQLLSATVNEVSVSNIDFIINPSTDPFVDGGVNIQPRVTIKMSTDYFSDRTIEKASLDLQTTVSSRIYRR